MNINYTQEEIKQKIEYNEKIIDEAPKTNFTLNISVASAIKENIFLRKICKHEFKDGICFYCGIPKEE